VKIVEIENRSRPLPAPLYAEYCQSFFCKLAGLAFRRRLAPDRALILVQSRENRVDSAIHMFGMAFDLTIIWLDNNLRVLEVRHARRWRSVIMPRHPARFVVECGLSHLDDFIVGDQLVFQTPTET
jgi:uncharacterized membrane protein (UPF0127 family)